MVSSLSSGQGDKAVHGRLRYADSRDESSAAGFAELQKIISTEFVCLIKAEFSLPGHGIAYIRQDCGKLFDQMRPIPSLLQLLDDANHDVIIDAFFVDFVVR